VAEVLVMKLVQLDRLIVVDQVEEVKEKVVLLLKEQEIHLLQVHLKEILEEQEEDLEEVLFQVVEVVLEELELMDQELEDLEVME
jgi:hypothetical protein